MSPPSPTSRFFNAKINENGRIVIPAAVRDQMGLKPGEAVVMEIDPDGILRIESHRAHIRRIQQEFSQPAGPAAKFADDEEPARKPTPAVKSASDQLIEDRQEEATDQMEEWLG